MPVFNGARFLAEAVRSVLEQTWADFEFVVVDDGSTDDTPEILASFSSDRRLVVHRQENLGVRQALNTGCRLARAPIIARMDSDDVSLPDRFSTQMEFLSEHPEVGVLGTGLRTIDADGRLGRTASYARDPGLAAWQILFMNCLAHPTVMMRRELLAEVGYYPACLAEDYALFLALSRRTRLASLPNVLLHYRVWGHSLTHQKFDALEQDARRVLRESARRWWSIDMTDRCATYLRGLPTDRYPTTGPDALEVGACLSALLEAFTATTDLQPAELKVVRTDAAVKMWLLAAVALPRAPLAASHLGARAFQISPTSGLKFAQKTASKLIGRR